MNQTKKCVVCGEMFTSNKTRHFYCSRKCFRRHYYKKAKEDNFPSYRCKHCGNMVVLDFDPRKDVIKWEFFVCPHCKTKREE